MTSETIATEKPSKKHEESDNDGDDTDDGIVHLYCDILMPSTVDEKEMTSQKYKKDDNGHNNDHVDDAEIKPI